MLTSTPKERAGLAAGLLLSALPSLAAFKAVPAFQEVFLSFGASLPLVTSLVVQYYPALLGLPLLVLATWLMWPRPETRGLTAFALGAVSTVVVPVAVGVALYLPILRMGAA